MTTVEKVLTVARGELGTMESPANSNRTPYGKWYGMDGQPWCMMFVQWCFDQAGGKLPYRTASCSALLAWYKLHRPKDVTADPQAGDVVLYNFGHTGIVESVGKGTITAIEGNTSPGSAGSQSNGGMVCRRTRSTSLVTAYIRPDYKMEEDGMDFDKWTDEAFVRFAQRMQNALAKQSVSAALALELAEAKERGITDGTSPCAFATRAQAAVMTRRAVE